MSPEDRDDILQETALRLYRSWSSVDQARGVEPYARTIALNLLRDSARRPSGEVLGDVPDVPDCGDTVERVTLARLEVGRVRRALSSLRPTERGVLRAAAVADDGVVVPAAVRMARMRARRQLAAVLRTASAWVLVLRALRVVRRPSRALATTAAACLVVVSLFHAGVPASPRTVRLGPGEAGDAANRREAGLMPTRPSVSRSAARAAAASRPRHRAGAHGDEGPAPAHIDLPGARVEVLASVDAYGFHAEVRDRGDDAPVCVSTPLGPLHQEVDCP